MKAKEPAKWTRSAVARRTGLGAETLRFYERMGLLEAPNRNAAGYRLYRPEDIERLVFIRRARQSGFGLQDIRSLLRLTADPATPRRKVRDFAKARLALIRRKIAALQAMEAALADLVSRCDGRGGLKGCPIAGLAGEAAGCTGSGWEVGDE